MAKSIRVSVYVNEEAEPELFSILEAMHSMRRAERLRYYATIGLTLEILGRGQTANPSGRAAAPAKPDRQAHGKSEAGINEQTPLPLLIVEEPPGGGSEADGLAGFADDMELFDRQVAHSAKAKS
jgi:hypothetical protein